MVVVSEDCAVKQSCNCARDLLPVGEEGTSGIYLLETRERNKTCAIQNTTADMRFAAQYRF
jgi:hypothetical protein